MILADHHMNHLIGLLVVADKGVRIEVVVNMERIKIFDEELPVKDYYCSDSPTKLRKTKPTLRLYIKLTDQCFANCKFCANSQSKDFGTIDLEKLAFVISYLKEKDILHGISITGGGTNDKSYETISSIRFNLSNR